MYISQELPQTAVYGSGEWKKEKGQACEKNGGEYLEISYCIRFVHKSQGTGVGA